MVLPGGIGCEDGWLALSAGMDRDVEGGFWLVVTGGLRTEDGWFAPTLPCATGLGAGAENFLGWLPNSFMKSLLDLVCPLVEVGVPRTLMDSDGVIVEGAG